MMSLRLARADQPCDGVHAHARRPCGHHRLVGRLLASDAVQPYPREHPVVVCRVRLPAEFATALEPQPVPRADERTAVHRARRQVRPEVRTGRRTDVQSGVGVPPRHDLQPADRRAVWPVADRVACGERVPVAAGSALRPHQRGVDDRGLGILVCRPLARPLFARKHCEGRPLRHFRRPAVEPAHRAGCLSRCASRRSALDRPCTGTVCRTCPASP